MERGQKRAQPARTRVGLRFTPLSSQGPVIEREDARRDYGEPRFIAIGTVEGEHLTVVYHPACRSPAPHLTRRASRKERDAYDQERSLAAARAEARVDLERLRDHRRGVSPAAEADPDTAPFQTDLPDALARAARLASFGPSTSYRCAAASV